jgi:hypothetical protein
MYGIKFLQYHYYLTTQASFYHPNIFTSPYTVSLSQSFLFAYFTILYKYVAGPNGRAV